MAVVAVAVTVPRDHVAFESPLSIPDPDGAAAGDGAVAEGLVPGISGPGGPVSGSGSGTVDACRERALQVPQDPYSPPCYVFSGDNGGATTVGVTRDEITVSIRAVEGGSATDIFSALGGQDIQEPTQTGNETAVALAEYFSKNFQFYGRKLKLEFFEGEGNGLEELLSGGKEKALADAMTRRPGAPRVRGPRRHHDPVRGRARAAEGRQHRLPVPVAAVVRGATPVLVERVLRRHEPGLGDVVRDDRPLPAGLARRARRSGAARQASALRRRRAGERRVPGVDGGAHRPPPSRRDRGGDEPEVQARPVLVPKPGVEHHRPDQGRRGDLGRVHLRPGDAGLRPHPEGERAGLRARVDHRRDRVRRAGRGRAAHRHQAVERMRSAPPTTP